MRLTLLVLLAGSLLGPPVVSAQSADDRRVVVLGPSEHDGRLDTVRQAIVFWNDILADLELTPRLVATTLVATAHGGRILENYTRQVWQQAGRLPSGHPGPREPGALSSLGADIVVFLSAQPTMSFAWPLREFPGHFVAIPAAPVARNVIAHELGHALGLSHHRDPSVLMCSPCPFSDALPEESFLPLTAADRRRLRELYGSAR